MTDEYTDEETTRRMENALRRALNTPPKPFGEIKGKSGGTRGKVVKRSSEKAPEEL